MSEPTADLSAIADLLGEVLGLELRAIPADAHQCPVRIVLGQAPESDSEGLFADPAREYGIHHHGMSWVSYRAGRPELGHAWDDNQEDTVGEPLPFEDWLRREVSSLVGVHLLREARSVWAAIGAGAGERAALLERAEAIGAEAERFHERLPDWFGNVGALRALLRLATGGGGQRERRELVACAPALSGHVVEPESPFGVLTREGLRMIGREIRLEVAAAIDERVKGEARSIVDGRLKGMSAARFGEYRRAFEACVGPVWDACFAVFDEAGRDPSLAARQNEEQREVQGWINEYNDLSREFATSSPREDDHVEERAGRLIAVEGRLNDYWRTRHADELDRCVDDGRFLSSGSAGYVGWLRNHGRYEEAVGYVCGNMGDMELSALRHRTHELAFETYVNNGLGSFLDSADPAHIERALALVDELERAVTLRTGDALYQVACVYARAGRVGDALGAVERAVEAGESIRAMSHDSDFATIANHPRFRALADQSPA